MGRTGKRSDMARELTELRVAVIELRERLTSEQQSTATVQYRLEELERRNHELAIRVARDQAAMATGGTQASPPARPTPEPTPPAHTGWLSPPPPQAAVSLDRLASVANSASNTAERNEHAIEELRNSLQRVHARLDELTFAMQSRLTELGFEIERAAASSRATAAVSDLALDRQLDVLRSSQIRLASEQARYEITLRSELADVADGLRRYTSIKGGRREHLDGDSPWDAPTAPANGTPTGGDPVSRR